MQKNLIIQNNVIEQDEFFICLILFFGLQPYVGLPFIFQTDVQPICLLFSIIYIFRRRFFNLTPINLLITCSLLFFAVLATFLCIFTNEPATIKEIIRRILPLYSGAIYYFTFSNILRLENISRIFKKTVFIFIFVWFVGVLLNIFTGNQVTSFFVNRAIFSEIGYSRSRYVSFFAEPSRVPEQCYFIFLMIYSIKDKYTKGFFIGIISILSIMSLASGSGQILFVIFSILPFLIFTLIDSIKNLFIYKLTYLKILILFLLSGISVFSFNYLKDSRGGNFVRSLYQIGPTALMLDDGIKVKLSGFMLVIARLFVPEVLFLSPIDPWYALQEEPILYSSYINVCRFFTGYDFCPQTYSVYSSLGSYIVYFGIIGAFLILIFYFICTYRIINLNNLTISKKIIWLTLLFSFILTSLVKVSLSNPSIFLVLALFLNFKNLDLKP